MQLFLKIILLLSLVTNLGASSFEACGSDQERDVHSEWAGERLKDHPRQELRSLDSDENPFEHVCHNGACHFGHCSHLHLQKMVLALGTAAGDREAQAPHFPSATSFEISLDLVRPPILA